MVEALRKWLPAGCVMGVILYLASITNASEIALGIASEAHHINGHFVLFAILCVAYYKAVKNIGMAFLLSVLYGIFIEIYQLFLPFRSSSLFDVAVDIFGASLAVGFLWKLLPLLPRKLQNLLRA